MSKQLDGYRPFHVPGCPDRTSYRTGDPDPANFLRSSTCTCPDSQFARDSKPIWKPGDGPVEDD